MGSREYEFDLRQKKLWIVCAVAALKLRILHTPGGNTTAGAKREPEKVCLSGGNCGESLMEKCGIMMATRDSFRMNLSDCLMGFGNSSL